MAAAPGLGRADAAGVADLTHSLYQQFGPQIYAYCLHRLRSREEAEDAVQTTFMNAFRALKAGTQTRAEQAWLYAIAKNVCAERLSTSSRRLRLESPSDFAVLEETVASPSRRGAEELMGLEAVLEAMPEKQRRAILLREWQGLSYREICDELGVSQAAVEMLIFRARRALAQGLEAPAEPATKQRLGRAVNYAIDLGTIVAALKPLLTGGLAVKAVAAAFAASAVTGAATEVARTPAQQPAPRLQAAAAAGSAVPRHRGIGSAVSFALDRGRD